MSQRKLVRHVDLPVSGTFQANVQSHGPVQSSFYHILLRNHVLSNALESETHILVFCCAARFCITFVASHQNEKSKAKNMARKNMAPKTWEVNMSLDRSWFAAIVLTAGLWTVPAFSQVIDLGKYPDWTGQWNRVPDGGPPRYDPSKPLRKQEAPLKPEYQALHEASMRDIDAGGVGLDTHYACMPMGMPRQMSGISLMEFLFTPGVTYILYEDVTAHTRRIYTDGRDFPKNSEPTFTGYSIGKWLDTDGDGRYDTLEIETRNIRGPRQWDQTGLPTADDNEAVIKERIFLDKANPNILHDEMTTTDNSLTRPWTVMKNYRRHSQNLTWEENNCIEANNYVTINKQVYFLSSEGHLMPQKKDQPPPDLRHFKPVGK